MSRLRQGDGGSAFGRRALVTALLLLSPMGMLYPLWWNPVSAGEDDVVYYYPLRRLTGEALGAGRLPLYTDREAGGMPILADPQSALWHPTTWLFAGLPDKLAYALSIFSAFSLAGAGAYRYLRGLRLIRPAAAFGAVAFMFCGFLVGHRVHLGLILSAGMLPWGLWGIERLRREPAGRRPHDRLGGKRTQFRWRRGVLVLAPVGFLALAAGHWPTVIHLTLIWGVYVLARARPLGRSLPAVVGAAGIALTALLPQVVATARLLAAATRSEVGYAMAGENSFFPPAGVLGLFPFLMGSRTPNFFAQEWWGPWHLCEMLGYVGLSTLALAGSAVWVLRRGRADPPLGAHQPVARTWAWIVLGAGVFMLGYYLPTYRLVHAIPILGVVRCPARMVVAVDMGLAVLAGVAVHILCTADGKPVRRLRRAIRRAACVVLPASMLGVLGLLTAAGFVLPGKWADRMPWPMNGGARDVLEAVHPLNPAVWVPLGFCIATVVVVLFWLRAPRRRAGLLVLLLLADLFVITRFVDVPPRGAVVPDPATSPAAAWLAEHDPDTNTYRVWGLGRSYDHRPAELLLPKTAAGLGVSTIANYGPFQSPDHAHLLGFRIFGSNRNWARMVRENYLLSAYGVKYLLAADPGRREIIESVRAGGPAPQAEGPNLLAADWELSNARQTGRRLGFRSPLLWRWSRAQQRVRMEPGRVYRIALDARAPDGAAGYLRAEVRGSLWADAGFDETPGALMAYPEQLGEDWRHFERTFQAPEANLPEEVVFRVYATGGREIEARDISLRAAGWPGPILLRDLPEGERVYELSALMPARRKGDPPVAVYRNRAWVRLGKSAFAPVRDGKVRKSGRDPVDIETLKWRPREALATGRPLPEISLPRHGPPPGWTWALAAAGAAAYGTLAVGPGLFRRRGANSGRIGAS